jgi:hypothetical protein
VEGHRKLDTARCSAIWLLILTICVPAASAADGPNSQDLQQGLALARSGNWEEARALLRRGETNAPRDKRFPLELAGIEYRRRNFGAAKRYLHRALTLDPQDSYANDFLGTMYYLEGNLEATLRYWNRIGKPRVDDIRITPQSKLDSVLLDSALAFSPASVLTLGEFEASKARLDGLDVFGAYRLELEAQPEERFDVSLHWLEPSPWLQAATMLRGVAYQTAEPELRDIGGSGVNWTSLLRWDAQKRRVLTSVEGPLRHKAKWRYRWYADARTETWNTGGPLDFRLQKFSTGGEFESIVTGRLSWHAGVEVSARSFDGLPAFRGGTALMYRAGLDYALLRIPEHRFTLNSSTGFDIGRMVSGTDGLFSHAQSTLAARWLPQALGRDYEMNAKVSVGTTQGAAPFDELFLLGIERDNDLWLRGHAGTVDGKKGSEPIGRNYVLSNWDIQKELYRNPLLTLAAGPFLDTAKTADIFHRAKFRPYLVDTGVEGIVRLPIGMRVTLVYGRDLRAGGHVLYATVGN